MFSTLVWELKHEILLSNEILRSKVVFASIFLDNKVFMLGSMKPNSSTVQIYDREMLMIVITTKMMLLKLKQEWMTNKTWWFKLHCMIYCEEITCLFVAEVDYVRQTGHLWSFRLISSNTFGLLQCYCMCLLYSLHGAIRVGFIFQVEYLMESLIFTLDLWWFFDRITNLKILVRFALNFTLLVVFNF